MCPNPVPVEGSAGWRFTRGCRDEGSLLMRLNGAFAAEPLFFGTRNLCVRRRRVGNCGPTRLGIAMSVKVFNRVWAVPPDAISSTEKLVLLNLADHAADDGGNAFPAVATIARETSLSDRAVQKSLRRWKRTVSFRSSAHDHGARSSTR